MFDATHQLILCVKRKNRRTTLINISQILLMTFTQILLNLFIVTTLIQHLTKHKIAKTGIITLLEGCEKENSILKVEAYLPLSLTIVVKSGVS